MIPDKFKIDAFLILIDISKERLEKQPIQDQLGKFVVCPEILGPFEPDHRQFIHWLDAEVFSERFQLREE